MTMTTAAIVAMCLIGAAIVLFVIAAVLASGYITRIEAERDAAELDAEQMRKRHAPQRPPLSDLATRGRRTKPLPPIVRHDTPTRIDAREGS